MPFIHAFFCMAKFIRLLVISPLTLGNIFYLIYYFQEQTEQNRYISKTKWKIPGNFYLIHVTDGSLGLSLYWHVFYWRSTPSVSCSKSPLRSCLGHLQDIWPFGDLCFFDCDVVCQVDQSSHNNNVSAFLSEPKPFCRV